MIIDDHRWGVYAKRETRRGILDEGPSPSV